MKLLWLKKILYISLSTLLGLIVSFLVHSILEMYLIQRGIAKGIPLEPSELLGANCYLPDYLNVGLLLAGLLGGFFLGIHWWSKVYSKK